MAHTIHPTTARGVAVRKRGEGLVYLGCARHLKVPGAFEGSMSVTALAFDEASRIWGNSGRLTILPH
jgi:hypothetical protein